MANSINYRSGIAKDADFIAWVILTAMRSHLDLGVLDYAIEGTQGCRAS